MTGPARRARSHEPVSAAGAGRMPFSPDGTITDQPAASTSGIVHARTRETEG